MKIIINLVLASWCVTSFIIWIEWSINKPHLIKSEQPKFLFPTLFLGVFMGGYIFHHMGYKGIFSLVPIDLGEISVLFSFVHTAFVGWLLRKYSKKIAYPKWKSIQESKEKAKEIKRILND